MSPSKILANSDLTVFSQYDTEEAAQFYEVIMGDGGADIHYGVFESPNMTCLEASANTVTSLIRLAETAGVKFDHTTHILDSGSGNGGSAHKIALEKGSNVTCLNICKGQNEANLERAKELGIEKKISVVTGTFEKLPGDWTDSFDIIWSQDAYVHSSNKQTVCREAFRVLKPGGFMVFTDIMASPIAAEEDIDWFKRRLHVDDLYSIAKYEEILEQTGFCVLRTRDLSGHLTRNYRNMIERITSERARLDKCSDEYLAKYIGNLKQNIEVLNSREAQAWQAVVCTKPSMASVNSVAATNRTGVLKRYVAAKLHNISVTDKSVYYHGSVSICKNLMKQCNILNYESCDIVNLRNGARWTTYAIPNNTPGAFTLNGGGARLGELGDECVVMTFHQGEKIQPCQVVYCDPNANNKIVEKFAYTDI